MSQPGSSRSVVIQDHQGKRRIVEVVPSALNQRKSMPPNSTKSPEFQYLSAASPQQSQRLQTQFKSEDSGSQPIGAPQFMQSGSSLPSTSSSGDNKKGMFSSSKTATPQKGNYIHGPGSLNKLAQSSMTISKRNHSLPSTSASTSTVVHQQNTTVSRKRKSDKIGKGLRHFSMKVCEKVEQKGITTYNEVADELVHEEISGSNSPTAGYDQKNIRRRVYDALNVLMAMNIISKEKKEIRWIGLPTNSMRECLELEKENEQRRERIAQKQQQLRDLILQQISYKNLVKRNREAEERGLVPAPNSAIHMPFIILNTHKKTHINCSISNDKSEYSFKFDDNYEIHDDLEVLKQMKLTMGLDTSNCRPEDVERAKQLVPKAFEKFIDMYAQGVDNDDSNGESNEYSSYSQYDDEYSNMSIKLESIETSDVTDDFNHGDMSGDEDDADSDV